VASRLAGILHWYIYGGSFQLQFQHLNSIKGSSEPHSAMYLFVSQTKLSNLKMVDT